MEITSIINNERMFTIKWRLTDWCNYRCSYCLRKFKGQDSQFNENKILAVAPQINRLIEESGKDTKINLIGGEITFLPLTKIIDTIQSKHLKRIHITTNFSNNIKYYIDLVNYLKTRNIDLSMNVSFHNEFIDLNTFLNKAFDFQKSATLYSFKVEFVVSPENINLLDDFKNKCNELNLQYLIEMDKSQPKSFFNGLNLESKVNLTRWVINYSDGSSTDKITRSQLINSFENKKFPSKDFYCSSGLSYIYVNQDMVCKNSNCVRTENYIPIFNYHITKNIERCSYPEGCSLCGNFSISKNKEDILAIL